MRKLTAAIFTGVIALALAPAVHAETKAAKFEVVSLSGTMTSTYTGTFAGSPPEEPIDERATRRQVEPCTNTWTETRSFSSTEKEIAFVSQRRAHGKLRTVWSLTKKPYGPFTSVPVRAQATTSRSLVRSSTCSSEEPPCSGEITAPYIFSLTGSRSENGGVLMGGFDASSSAFGDFNANCPFQGRRALDSIPDNIDYDDPYPHLFRAKDLFNPKKRTLTSDETFTVDWTDGKRYSGTSTVELTGTIKRK
jgi:hypothetical protein